MQNFESTVSSLSDSDKHIFIKTGVWKESNPIPLARLKTVNFSHYTFEGDIKTGILTTLDTLTPVVQTIFRKLFDLQFPIYQAIGLEHFEGCDEKSMSANNTSCFNGRVILGTNRFSVHAYGAAIDINPLQNPMIIPEGSHKGTYPSTSESYTNRTPLQPGMVTPEVVQVFKENGFTIWGGDWTDPIDYHHFQIPRDIAEQLAKLTFEEGKSFFDQYVTSTK